MPQNYKKILTRHTPISFLPTTHPVVLNEVKNTYSRRSSYGHPTELHRSPSPSPPEQHRTSSVTKTSTFPTIHTLVSHPFPFPTHCLTSHFPALPLPSPYPPATLNQASRYSFAFLCLKLSNRTPHLHAASFAHLPAHPHTARLRACPLPAPWPPRTGYKPSLFLAVFFPFTIFAHGKAGGLLRGVAVVSRLTL